MKGPEKQRDRVLYIAQIGRTVKKSKETLLAKDEYYSHLVYP